MSRALSVRSVETAKPTAVRREIPDDLVPGLYLMVQPSGAKAVAHTIGLDGPETAAHASTTGGAIEHCKDYCALKQENAMLARELAEARLELAQRDTRDAFAAAPSPSSLRH